jgi:hypothetical protein
VTRWLERLPWSVVLIACASLGLAPFVPVPHVVEKLGMLFRGQLVRPIDWFDLVMHGAPWALLVGKAVVVVRRRPAA